MSTHFSSVCQSADMHGARNTPCFLSCRFAILKNFRLCDIIVVIDILHKFKWSFTHFQMPMATVSSKTMSLFLKNTAVKSGEDE